MRSLPGTVGILVLLLPVHPTPIEAATQINLQVDDMPKQFNREITGKDGARMVLIPAGTFMMGRTEGRADKEPVHRVSPDTFYLDKYEVTNKLLQKFV
jgi:formylglycine-generating enzyme required for sulfatase activity